MKLNLPLLLLFEDSFNRDVMRATVDGKFIGQWVDEVKVWKLK